jgi:hypothetical protein
MSRSFADNIIERRHADLVKIHSFLCQRHNICQPLLWVHGKVSYAKQECLDLASPYMFSYVGYICISCNYDTSAWIMEINVLLFLIMQNKTKWPYWLVVRVTRPEPPIQVDPEPLPFRGTRFRAAQSLVFCIVLCCSLFVLWSFFSFRHCIVCQTMTFVLLDIVLSVKLWLFSFGHCIVCQTMTFFF